MLRILHTADIHIGVENYSRADPTTGLPTRLLDFLAALDEAIDFAISNEVDLFLFCGDAYKSRDPSQTHQREFAQRIARLAQEGIAVFLLVGNHDLPNAFGRATALEIFHTLPLPGVTVANHLQTYQIETRKGPVQVVALPWARRGSLLAREEARGLSFQEVNDRIQDLLVKEVRHQAEALDPARPALLAGHITVSSAKLSSERSLLLGRDYVLPPSALALPQFDYAALGHIHRAQLLWENPPLVYSGSLQRVDFGEEEDDKGFYVLDIDPSASPGRRLVDYHFEPVHARRFLTIDVTISDEDPDPTATVVAAIARRYIEDAVVRVRLHLSASQEGSVREAEIRRTLEPAYYVAAISREVHRPERVRLGRGMAVEELAPLEALEHYLDARQTLNARRQTLLSYAQHLLEELDGPAEEQHPE